HMDGRADRGGPGPCPSQARGLVRDGPLRARLHDLGPAQCAGRRPEPSVLRLEWRGPNPRARLALEASRPVQVLLEVGQVAARARDCGTQPSWILLGPCQYRWYCTLTSDTSHVLPE